MMSGTSNRESSQPAAGDGVAAGKYDGVAVEPIKRRLYDSEAGLEFCTELIIQDEETVMTM